MSVERINIRVRPNAPQNTITELDDGTLQVRLTTSPVDGKANEALIKRLSKYLGVAQRDITIVRGQRSKNKVIEVIR